MRLAEDETAIVVLPHQAPYREERGKILRQRRCKRNPRRRHPEDNDKNQVQKYVEHPCRGKIVQRMLCVALRAEYRASEVVDEYSRRACEVYDHILNRLLKRVLRASGIHHCRARYQYPDDHDRNSGDHADRYRGMHRPL